MLENIDLKQLSFLEVIKTLEDKRKSLLEVKKEVDRSLEAIDFTIKTLTNFNSEKKVVHLPAKEPGSDGRGRKPRYLTANGSKTSNPVLKDNEVVVDGKRYKKPVNATNEKKRGSGHEMSFKAMALKLLTDKGAMQPIELKEAIVKTYGTDENKTANNLGVLLPNLVGKMLVREKREGKSYYSIKS